MNAWSEIYQWTDDKGQTHFSDRAPSKITAKKISNQMDKINITSDLSSPEMMLRHEQAKDAEREKRYQYWQEQQENKPTKDEKCKELKQLLKIVKGRVVFVDEQGKDLKISEKLRQQRAIELEDSIRKHCR
jgi:transcriptional regulator with PAS, ATPase and Fis domain